MFETCLLTKNSIDPVGRTQLKFPTEFIIRLSILYMRPSMTVTSLLCLSVSIVKAIVLSLCTFYYVTLPSLIAYTRMCTVLYIML